MWQINVCGVKLNPLTGFSNFLNLDTMQVSLPAPKAILMLVVPRFCKHERNMYSVKTEQKLSITKKN